jgi:hypothetical protein
MEAVILPELATWLRQERRARGWPTMEMARRLCEAARASGDSTVPGKEAMCRNIRRWESGRGGVSERYTLHYCKAFGIPSHTFGPAPGPEDASVMDRMAAPPDQAGPPIPSGNPWPLEISDTSRRELLRIFSMARAVLPAREFLAATAEMVSPDTPPDELLRHLTHYRAHLSALAASGLPLAQTGRRLASYEAGMSLVPAAGSILDTRPESGRLAGRPMVRQDA